MAPEPIPQVPRKALYPIDRLTQHLAGWGIFLDCASKRQRLRRCGEEEVEGSRTLYPKVPSSALCSRASAKQRTAPDTVAAGPWGPAPLYLQRLLRAAVVPPRRGNGTARWGSGGSLDGSGALQSSPLSFPSPPVKRPGQGARQYKRYLHGHGHGHDRELSRRDKTLTGACQCGQGNAGSLSLLGRCPISPNSNW